MSTPQSSKPWPKVQIPDAEFAERRRRAQELARAKGLDGLIVCSRGGGTTDRYADVLYLANFYTSYPFTPDLAPHWTGRAHSFLVLPVGDPGLLVADIPYLQGVAMPADRIEKTDNVIESVAAALQRFGLARGRVGLVGEDVLPTSMYQALTRALPDLKVEPADAILAELRRFKSPAEIDRLRASAKLGSRMLDAMMQAAVPGATHGDVVAAGMQVLVPAGGMLYNSFMASGTGGDEPTVHRSTFPTWRSDVPLKKGMWLRLGISGILDGYYFDVSRARPIGPPTNRQIDAFEAAIATVQTGIERTRVGTTAGAIAEAGLKKQVDMGYPLEGVFSGLGHGLGMGWDTPWLVPGEPTVIKPGMVLNFERTLSRDGYLGDFEETILVGENGIELLTDAKLRYW
ncbi:MAG: aminopeptidase P family protein [Alphaproteobacteria bacterium]|nr:aminopeptidase P family protein [Alphaproteobacteria bacterium]